MFLLAPCKARPDLLPLLLLTLAASKRPVETNSRRLVLPIVSDCQCVCVVRRLQFAVAGYSFVFTTHTLCRRE